MARDSRIAPEDRDRLLKLAYAQAAGLIAAGVVFAAMPLQIIRITARAFLGGMPPRIALAFGTMTMLSKWAWFRGQLKYYLDRARGRGLELIEYKGNSSEPPRVIPVRINLGQKAS